MALRPTPSSRSSVPKSPLSSKTPRCSAPTSVVTRARVARRCTGRKLCPHVSPLGPLDDAGPVCRGADRGGLNTLAGVQSARQKAVRAQAHRVQPLAPGWRSDLRPEPVRGNVASDDPAHLRPPRRVQRRQRDVVARRLSRAGDQPFMCGAGVRRLARRHPRGRKVSRLRSASLSG